MNCAAGSPRRPCSYPPAPTSWVEDDFSDVYGLLYGFTVPDGYDIATIRDAARL